MPVMPGVIWKGDQSSKRRMERYDVFCIHTIVGYAPAHAAHFSVFADGDIYQSRDTLYTSAANLNGNHRIIASENEDHGARFGGTPRLPAWVPLTPEQVAANAEIYAWLHETHDIPLQMNPDSRPSSRGLGYHRQGIDGNFAGYRFQGRVSGGEVWTEAYGKVCPTDARIAQLPDILTATRNLLEPDMTPEQYKTLADAQTAKILEAVTNQGEKTRARQIKTASRIVATIKRNGKATQDDIAALEEALAE
ncbi:peptidoglycan recognition protein family protein [Nocardioides kribbensis]|uniref:peptidoglycan recognition protein family protein n=1 Tax=Nocardioides kribbensis TaxID=305517 RepID=UPI0018797B9C|nr:N-acetylmuramoyl-L-alanine amidase [Nocardioides kribbensis]